MSKFKGYNDVEMKEDDPDRGLKKNTNLTTFILIFVCKALPWEII